MSDEAAGRGPPTPRDRARDSVNDVIRKAATAATKLRNPHDDKWAVYELARCAIDHLLNRYPANVTFGLLEEALVRLERVLEEACQDRT